MFKPIALAFAITLPTLGHAQDFVRRERFTIPVNQIDGTTFEVIEADAAGGTQIWCAAGIYARNVLGLRGGDLYIAEGRGDAQTASGRKGVTFSTQAVSDAFSSVGQGVRRSGKVFSMAHAYALCRNLPFLRVRTSNDQLVRR
ncbi:hypothetical protein GCM10007385_21440 [Tateyamaria omphalii]|uniref:hypothetical protein n=1 Tax=Tateyamaria omphalii TaxID=299262 RepID=UPI00167B94B5|nr:hypothetical protein [Tateyamaria omphalii]GGX53104.1 hypothetical protein GCM10007385_21440 [Tateyamaria omphalii]